VGVEQLLSVDVTTLEDGLRITVSDPGSAGTTQVWCELALAATAV
jgi:hypothetical protein